MSSKTRPSNSPYTSDMYKVLRPTYWNGTYDVVPLCLQYDIEAPWSNKDILNTDTRLIAVSVRMPPNFLKTQIYEPIEPPPPLHIRQTTLMLYEYKYTPTCKTLYKTLGGGRVDPVSRIMHAQDPMKVAVRGNAVPSQSP